MRAFVRYAVCLWTAILAVGFACGGPAAYGQEPERLKASKVEARGGLRGMKPMLGLPELMVKDQETLVTNSICGHLYGEKITCEKGVWVSQNLDFGMPNWVAFDVDPTVGLGSASSSGMGLAGASGSGMDLAAAARDQLMARMPKGSVQADTTMWNDILDECWKWAMSKPMGGTTIACGPLVYGEECKKGSAAVPYELFLVVCKKTRDGLGYKSIAFLLPNRPIERTNPYKYSQSVGLVEYKSGYRFFPKLPSGIASAVKAMTTYELFCSYVEYGDYGDDPDAPELDWMSEMSEFMEDMRGL